MAAREKIAAGLTPYLEPGEQVRHVFGCQTGPSPWWSVLTYLVVMFGSKYRTVAVTDRAIVVGKSGMWAPFRTKELVGRLPRNTRIGPLTGIWAKADLGQEQVWIHKRFHKDVEAADAEIGG